MTEPVVYNGSHYTYSNPGYVNLVYPMCSGYEGYLEMCDAESWMISLACNTNWYAEVDCNPVDAGESNIV